LETELIIAITGIGISSFIALVGLYLNYLALRQSNRIAVSTKLAEASKLLSDELIALVRSYQAYKAELKETEARPDTSDDKVQKKIASLKLLINNSLKRQNEIDAETVEIQSMFSQLNKVDPGNVDAKIAVSYRMQAKALGTMQYISSLQSQKPKNQIQTTTTHGD
jgi:hypothetical protein